MTSVAKFLQENEGNRLLVQNQGILSAIRVLAKIVAGCDDKFTVNVTICNNRQNPVEPWNLRASDWMQLELQDKFRKDLGIFYERQENWFASMTDSELEELGIEESYKPLLIRGAFSWPTRSSSASTGSSGKSLKRVPTNTNTLVAHATS